MGNGMSSDSNDKELELTPGVVTTSNINISSSNSQREVTHDEAFEFSERYHKGWEKIEEYWNNIIGAGVAAIVIGAFMGLGGLATDGIFGSLTIVGIIIVLIGFSAIGYAYEKLKFIKTGKEYMLKTNIRIRSK